MTRRKPLRRSPWKRGAVRGRGPARLGTARDPVYQAVDTRSKGLCEVVHGRPHRAVEHHHLFHPRLGTCERCDLDHLRGHHRWENILHVCRSAHREFEREYAKGRRVPREWSPWLGRYHTEIVTAADKWAARALGA